VTYKIGVTLEEIIIMFFNDLPKNNGIVNT